MTLKKGRTSVQILGITLNSTSTNSVLEKIMAKVQAQKTTFVATGNPEFLVYAQKNLWFKKLLNSADLVVPDGAGLLFASWFLKTQPRLKQRVAGADLAAALLSVANKRGWRVGVVGVRRGEMVEGRKLLTSLSQKYPNVQFVLLEDTPNWQKQSFQLIFACQGMGKQEKWIAENKVLAKGAVLLGAGGSLDFLTGFACRAPEWLRRAGLEWFWRLVLEPWRWRRQLALVKFIWLIFKEK